MDRNPELLWRYFADLSRIPRGSGNEAGVREYIRNYAGDRSFGYHEDSVGNCLVSVPGRGAGASAPAITIQAHMDMVCVKDEGVVHDFTRDPIRLRETTWTEKGVTQDVLMATGTTLGADNGIGLVAALAVAVDPAITDCPPLELLCTVDEETGLTGAGFLDPELLRTDMLINLDTEELGDICISCAGGRDMTTEWQIERHAPLADEVPVRLYLSGLPGGHSGVQIHEMRGNAITMLLAELLDVKGADGTMKLARITGGAARNVIPSAADIVVWTSEARASNIDAVFSDPALRAGIEKMVRQDEEHKISVGCEILLRETAPHPISPVLTRKILYAIAAIPNGVQAWTEMVRHRPDGKPVVTRLVETSNNVAVISTTEDAIRLQCSTRSSKVGAIEAFQEAAAKSLAASGATVTYSDGYPGWPIEVDSPLLAKALHRFAAVLGREPGITAVHAGLECGVLQSRRGAHLDMISFGPDIRGAHTVNERIMLDSVPPFYACLTGLLHDLAHARA